MRPAAEYAHAAPTPEAAVRLAMEDFRAILELLETGHLTFADASAILARAMWEGHKTLPSAGDGYG